MDSQCINFEQQVLAFHKKYGHLINSSPTPTLPQNVKALREALIKEETDELFRAMDDSDIVEIADALADLMYVVIGTAISYGVPITRVFNEVHQSNMTKTAVKATEGQKYGTKTPKGPDYIAPHIWKILFEPQFKTPLELMERGTHVEV